MVVIKLNINIASIIRTKTNARLQRTISLNKMHQKLMEFFVDRINLENEIQENIKPQFDVSVFTTREYMKKEYCYTTFTEPQCKDYYETQFGFDESDLMFIKDGGAES